MMTWTDLKSRLGEAGYVASNELAMAIHIALQLERPILLEGDAGVGKTQVAKTLAEIESTELIRLQCYEGLDAAAAIYEWNYQRQLLSIRAAADSGASAEAMEARIFSREFLLERPLLRAIQQDRPPVLLIDEIDRADEEFEAFLLEVLSDFQITIPELGTIAATSRPIVVLTANGTRDLSDALRRRCIYSHVPYPDRATELAILEKRGPDLSPHLAAQIVGFVQAIRKEDLDKKPGVAETLDWAAALAGLGLKDLTDDPVALQASLVALLKTEADQAAIPAEVAQRLAGVAG
ncbi:MAG: ATPase [SAR116 cluster bacterium MED-G06]|jgi:MoxR-like ATPase|nr:MAG: ATPase [SAR116 cluster bacterium MED-G06]|tara:strand:+ start:5346 stop:6224 length:879 start_codon:yes stop_codon:yes gene_type:complete